MWKVLKFFWKNLKKSSKITKKSLFFPLFGKKSFLNRTLDLRKSFLNQTTYVLKNQLHQQSFLNRDSFLNQPSLNRDSTVLAILVVHVKKKKTDKDLLPYQNFIFLFYLGWSGSFPQIRQNIMGDNWKYQHFPLWTIRFRQRSYVAWVGQFCSSMYYHSGVKLIIEGESQNLRMGQYIKLGIAQKVYELWNCSFAKILP